MLPIRCRTGIKYHPARLIPQLSLDETPAAMGLVGKRCEAWREEERERGMQASWSGTETEGHFHFWPLACITIKAPNSRNQG